MLFAISAPADHDRGPDSMQQALAALHGSVVQLQFEFGSFDSKVGLCCRVPDETFSAVIQNLKAKYPGCGFERLAATALQPDHSFVTHRLFLRLTPELFPILRHAQFDDLLRRRFDDPLESILRAVQPVGPLRPHVSLILKPAAPLRTWWANRAVRKLNRSFFRQHDQLAQIFAHGIMCPRLWPLAWLLGIAAATDSVPHIHPIDTAAGRSHQREEDLQAASDKLGGHLFDVSLELRVYGPRSQRVQARRHLLSIAGAFGAFTISRLAVFRACRRARPCLMSHEEIATIFHPPTSSLEGEAIHRSCFTELEAPADLPPALLGTAILGRVKHGDDRRPVTLLPEDRLRHLYLVGKTGMGKTTMLRTLIERDIESGRGVCVIDPHGDLTSDIEASVPKSRTNDVIILDPSDADNVFGYNPLECRDPVRRDLVADDVHSAFDRIYGFSQSSHRLSDTLRNALYVLIEKRRTLLDLLYFFADDSFRAKCLVGIEDELARTFWLREFPNWNKQDRNLTVAAIQNKVRPFLMNRAMRAVVSQRKKTLNLRRVMDRGQILLISLPKGKLGEGNANLLGALLVTGLQQAALSRADIPESGRRDFFAYIDEFQNFTTSSFATILSEARKYRLSLTIAHQYLRQIEPSTLDAIFGNVGSLVAFQVGCDDAAILSRQLSKVLLPKPQVQPEHLANLPKYHAYARLLIDGFPSEPFSLCTLERQPSSSPQEPALLNRGHSSSEAGPTSPNNS